MNDLIKRLRDSSHLCTGLDSCVHCEAIDEIERLRNKLNANSQAFELECRKAQVELLERERDEAITMLTEEQQRHADTQRAYQQANMALAEAQAEVQRERDANKNIVADFNRLVAAIRDERERRCETCADYRPEYEACGQRNNLLYMQEVVCVPADFGCPHWRAKEVSSE